jgi:anti-sigma regulatory factor (Ser/Thr protein kinase)/PAS domain-containing protein
MVLRMAGTEVPPTWEEAFAADPASVSAIRRALAGFARAHGASEDLVGDLALAVSEAATNAVVHAFVGTEPGTVRVSARPAPGAFEVTVADDGQGMRPRGDSPGLGLGLPTIAQLTSSFDIRDGDDGRGTVVRMVFDAPGIRAPEPDEGTRRRAVLDEIDRLASATGWPAEGVDRLAEVLVPALADACAIDLVEADGPRRVTARVHPDPDGAMTTWLAGRSPSAEALRSAIPATRPDDVHLTALGDDVLQDLAGDPDDLARMRRLAFAWWVTIPLTEGGVLLGTLGLGLGPGRPDPHGELELYAELGRRTGAGLASGRLVDELQRTRRRLERILSALSEAVMVQDAEGRVVYANDAAARLLELRSVDELLTTPPEELIARFTIRHEDGTPVDPAELPGFRVLDGAQEASMLTRSIIRASGTEHWLLTKTTRLEDDGPFAVNIVEDITEAKNAELRRRVLAEAAGVAAAAARGDGALADIAALTVPAIADWCAIDVGGERTAEAGAPAPHRSTLAAAIGPGATLRLATAPEGRVLTDADRTFAADLTARIAPILAR